MRVLRRWDARFSLKCSFLFQDMLRWFRISLIMVILLESQRKGGWDGHWEHHPPVNTLAVWTWEIHSVFQKDSQPVSKGDTHSPLNLGGSPYILKLLTLSYAHLSGMGIALLVLLLNKHAYDGSERKESHLQLASSDKFKTSIFSHAEVPIFCNVFLALLLFLFC